MSFFQQNVRHLLITIELILILTIYTDETALEIAIGYNQQDIVKLLKDSLSIVDFNIQLLVVIN